MNETSMRAAAAKAAAKVMTDEIERAQRWVEERIRERVLAIPADLRYRVQVGGQMVEAIDARAVAVAIGASAATDLAGV